MQQLRRPSGKQVHLLQEALNENHKVSVTSLDSGMVPDDADLLLMIAPKNLTQKQVFAVDQFLMKGGTVILATAPFSATMGRNISASKYAAGLKGWLDHNGIVIDENLVLDPNNAMLPIPVNRNLGGFTIQEVRMVEYPYFVDVRDNGLIGKEMTAGLPQVTMNWASPINVDQTKNKDRNVIELLKSSDSSWVSDSTQVVPDFKQYGRLGFESPQQRQAYPLAVAVEGRFESYFKGKDSPLLSDKEDKDKKEEAVPEDDKGSEDSAEKPVYTGVIEKSPESARIIVFASNEFLTDETIQLAASSSGSLYVNSLQLMENAVDWSLEDRGLLSIRGRGHFSRTLRPLTNQGQIFLEYLNYGLAVIGLLVVYFIYRRRRRKAQIHYAEVLEVGRA